MSKGRRRGAEGEAARRRAEQDGRHRAPENVPPPAPETVARLTRGNNRWDALRAVQEAVRLERSVARRRHRAVVQARAAGASWTDLARVLEVSPQAVQQKYGKRGVSPESRP